MEAITTIERTAEAVDDRRSGSGEGSGSAPRRQGGGREMVKKKRETPQL